MRGQLVFRGIEGSEAVCGEGASEALQHWEAWSAAALIYLISIVLLKL